MALPDFFLLGAAKAGTTSLWFYLRRHPGIAFPWTKEPSYFAFPEKPVPSEKGPPGFAERTAWLYRNCITGREEYEALYDELPPGAVKGDASVRYLYYPDVPERVRKAAPDARFIIVLRDPVERLYSHYAMVRGEFFLEPLSLRDALRAEPHRIAEGWGWDWHYAALGMYAPQLRRWFEAFSPERFLVVFHDELQRDPLATVRRAYEFLGVDPDFEPNVTQRHLVTAWPRSARLERFLHTSPLMQEHLQSVLGRNNSLRVQNLFRRLNRGRRPILSPAERTELMQPFRADARELEDLLGRPVPWARR